jgi:hypothetical protein
MSPRCSQPSWRLYGRYLVRTMSIQACLSLRCCRELTTLGQRCGAWRCSSTAPWAASAERRCVSCCVISVGVGSAVTTWRVVRGVRGRPYQTRFYRSGFLKLSLFGQQHRPLLYPQRWLGLGMWRHRMPGWASRCHVKSPRSYNAHCYCRPPLHCHPAVSPNGHRPGAVTRMPGVLMILARTMAAMATAMHKECVPRRSLMRP